MRFLLKALALLSLLSACAAQPVSFEAVRLADVLLASTWEAQEQSIPVLISGLQSQLKSTGASETASSVFAEELRRSMNKEDMTKVVAQALTQKLTESEQKELSLFMRSSIGQKYLQLNKEMLSNSAYFTPIIKQACAAATQRLSTPDRATIVSTCGRS